MSKPKTTVKKWSTGAKRDNLEGKGRFDLLSSIALYRLALVAEYGGKHYGDHNWEKGMPLSNLLNHAIRHIYLYIGGDRTQDHLAKAMWGLHAAIHTEHSIKNGLLPTDLDDIGSNTESMSAFLANLPQEDQYIGGA